MAGSASLLGLIVRVQNSLKFLQISVDSAIHGVVLNSLAGFICLSYRKAYTGRKVHCLSILRITLLRLLRLSEQTGRGGHRFKLLKMTILLCNTC